ncbi:ABC transporter ATP-binding protein [Bacillus sp. V3B]|uniref:ATP-binding cassette domain-containing protein n=1 Tax=Bacillus sp. V3B TaxID=2804915 RepID=UPI00210B7CE1|nr:ABC transporter ATP-binding protein [Bacillus sp. V3B]MCQ6277574.1 ABC transporter ATP-binding protein [Bacillus sp. V3B]
MKPILKFIEVTKTVEQKKILNNISFEIPKGKIIAFLGQNGAGKTTTLKIASGLLTFDNGKVLLNDTPISMSKKDVIFIPDFPFLYEELTGYEYIQFVLDLFNLKLPKDEMTNLIIKYDLEKEIGKKINNLSLGNKKKLSLLTSLLNNPKLLLLDEFISGIDPINMKKIKLILKEFVDKGNSILLSTHQLEVAQGFCDSIIVINEGEILRKDIDVSSILEKNNNLEDYFMITLALGGKHS